MNRDGIFFAFSDDQVTNDRRNKTCVTCTGFHLFKTFGSAFDGKTKKVVSEISVRIVRNSRKKLKILHLPSMKIPSQRAKLMNVKRTLF